jgi:serine/threonine-protein phosphatase 2A regulatory subunit B''
VDILASAPTLDANNLEQLVNNFVVEDKARLAAARQLQKSSPAKSLPSSIQFALQKFEKQIPSDIQTQGSKSPPSSSSSLSVKSTGLHHEIKSQPLQAKSPAVGAYTSHVTRSPAASAPSSTSQQITPVMKSSTPLHHRGSTQLDTIETTFPRDLSQQTKRLTAETSSDTTSPTTSSSGLTTWPLKNKSVAISGGNDRRSAVGVSPTGSDVSGNRKDDPTSSSGKYVTSTASKSNGSTKDAVAYLDEVAREEERLINALKTGIIIAEDPTKMTVPGNKISEKKTSSVLHKKSSTKDNKVSSVAKKTKKQQPAEMVTPKFPITAAVAQTRISSETSGAATSVPSPTVSTVATPQSQSFVPSPVSKLSSSTELESPKSQQAQTLPAASGKDELDKSSLSNLSVVDYAKVRYRAAQQNPLTQQRLEDVKQFEQQRSIAGITSVSGGASVDSKHLHHNEVIPVARNRFQVSPRPTSSDGHVTPTSPSDSWRPDWLPGGRGGADDEVPHVKRKTGTPSTNLSRPVRHPPLDTHPPHQENALQQRFRTTGTGSVTNPVRPFLTRGSVAERVLIFEKCPSELLLEKRSRGAPAITTWRSGHDVHTKAQVCSFSHYMYEHKCMSKVVVGLFHHLVCFSTLSLRIFLRLKLNYKIGIFIRFYKRMG